RWEQSTPWASRSEWYGRGASISLAWHDTDAYPSTTGAAARRAETAGHAHGRRPGPYPAHPQHSSKRPGNWSRQPPGRPSVTSCRRRSGSSTVVWHTLPWGRRPMGRRRVLDTSSLANLFPWFDKDADLQQPGDLVGASRKRSGSALRHLHSEHHRRAQSCCKI